MKYDLSVEFDRKKAESYFKRLIEKKEKINLEKQRDKRTNQQNKYLHVCISLIALELGYTLIEMKTELKRQLGYTYEKNGKKFVKSTADMNTSELSEFTEKVRNWASQQGMYVPSPDEHLSGEAERYVERNRVYL